MPFDPNAPVETVDAPAAPAGFDPNAPIEAAEGVATFHPNETVETEEQPSPRDALAQVGGIPKGLSVTQRAARERLFKNISLDPKTFAKPLVGYGAEQGTFGTIPAIPELGKTPVPGFIPAPIPADIQAGVVNAAAPALASFTSPENIAILLATGGSAKIVQRLVSGGFGLHMVKSAIDAVPDAVATLDDDKVSRQKKTEVVGNIITNLVMGAAAGKHALRGEVAPGAAPAVETAKPGEVPKVETPAATEFKPDAEVEPVTTEATAQPPTLEPQEVKSETTPVTAQPADYQYTLQREQDAGDGRKIPGYLQVDEIRDGENTRSSNIEDLRKEGIELPDAPDHLPSGRYTLAEIKDAIAKGEPAKESVIPKSEPKVFKPDDPVQDVVPERVDLDDADAIDAESTAQNEAPPPVLEAMMNRAIDRTERERTGKKQSAKEYLDEVKFAQAGKTEEKNTIENPEIVDEVATPAPKTYTLKAPKPLAESISTVEDALAYRRERISNYRNVLKEEIGLNDDQASRLEELLKNDRETGRFEKKLTPDQREKLEKFFDGPLNQRTGPLESWTEGPADLEGFVHSATKDEAAAEIVRSTGNLGALPEADTSDRFLTPILALNKLKELGGSWRDVDSALQEKLSRMRAGDDTPELYAAYGKQIKKFAEQHGIDLPLEVENKIAIEPKGENPNKKNMPAWARERMIQEGLDPARPLNDIDTKQPSIIAGVEADSTLTPEQKTQLLKTGSPEAPRPPSAELKANNAGMELPPVSSMTRAAKRAELDAAGIKDYRGKALDDINPAELSAAVGKVRRGTLTPEGEKPGGVISGSKAEEWADRTLQAKKGQLNAGIDPEHFAAYAVKGLANFERGLQDFAKWSKEMTKQFGEEIEPHLENIFRATKELNEEGTRASDATPEELKAFLADYRNAPAAKAAPTAASRTARLLQGLTGAKDALVDVATLHLAKESAPRTTAKSEASGNALVRYASATLAAPEVAKSYAGQVLGEKLHDKEFSNKLGAVLVEDRLHGIKAGLLRQAEEARTAGDVDGAAEFHELASQVTTLVGKPDSPFKSEADYQAALKDKDIQAAIEKHRTTVMPFAEKQHADLGGRISKPGPDTGAFVNLEPIDAEGDIPGGKKGGGASKGDLTTPFKKGSAFSKRAYGTADNYVTDYNEIVRRMVSGNFEETAKRAMYDQLTQDGLATILPPGEAPSDINGSPPRKIQIERRGLPGPGGGRQLIRNLWVDQSVYPEVIRAMNLDETFKGAGAQQLANVLNTIQIKGPVDGVVHVANILTSISGSQGGGSVVKDIIRRLPGVNIVDSIAKVTMRARDVVRDSPEVREQLAKLSEMGAGRRPHDDANAMGKFIGTVDKAARLVRDDMYDNLVERGLAQDSERGRREFVNQIGQYNARLSGQIAAKLKETGVSPFIVAGRTFNRLALRRVTADPGVTAKTTAAAAQMRALEVANLVTGLVVVPMTVNYMLTGKPMGRPGTPVGAIDTGKTDDKGKIIYIDPQQWSGVRRGLRITGANAVMSGVQHGEGSGRIVDEAAREMIGSYLHPAAGPLVNLGLTAATGYNTSSFRQAEKAAPGESQLKENAIAAAKQLNPLIESAIEGFNKDGGAGGALKGTTGSLATAFGVKKGAPITSLQQMRTEAGKFNDTLGIARDASGRTSPYAALNKALAVDNYDDAEKALGELIQSKIDAQPANISETAKNAIAKRAVAEFYAREARSPFTGNLARERAFKAQLDDDAQQTYAEAREDRRQTAAKVRKLLYRH